jgi:hypothetical protein
MRKNALFLCLVALVFAAVGCGDKNNPESVAEQFLTALDNKDFDKAKTFSTEETHKMLDLLKGFADQVPAAEDAAKPEAKKITECKVDGDKATCSYCCDEQGASSELALIKVNGEWKADMSKETLMGGEGAMDGMGEEPALDEEPALELEVTDSTVTTEEGM